MKKQWKQLMSVVLILVAAISLSGCAVLLELLDEELSATPQTPLTSYLEPQDQTSTPDQSQSVTGTETTPSGDQSPLALIDVAEDGEYTSKMEVAAYLYQFGRLPANYLTKNEAQDLGWVAQKGNLWKVTDQMSIGGDRFGNYEGLLPKKNGRQYYECDIDYNGGSRNAKRIVFSNDGLIFYTDDHYESFEQLN